MVDPSNGIKLGNHKGKRKKAKNSFLGLKNSNLFFSATEAVDYLRKNKKIPVNEISRKHCIELCQLLIYMGFLSFF
jgi:hypothetical protein